MIDILTGLAVYSVVAALTGLGAFCLWFGR